MQIFLATEVPELEQETVVLTGLFTIDGGDFDTLTFYGSEEELMIAMRNKEPLLLRDDDGMKVVINSTHIVSFAIAEEEDMDEEPEVDPTPRTPFSLDNLIVFPNVASRLFNNSKKPTFQIKLH